MAFSLPVAISVVGDARLVRNVFRPAFGFFTTPQTYISYVAELEGFTRVVFRSTLGVDFSEVAVPAIFQNIDGYSVVCLNDDTLLLVWSDGIDLRRLVFDLKTPTVVGAQTVIAQGNNPELTNPTVTTLQMFYTRGSQLFRRKSVNAGSTWNTEQPMNDPSNSRFDRYGTSQKPGSTKFNYLADVGFGPKTTNGIALPLTIEGTTTLLLNGTSLQTEGLTAGQPSVANYYTMDNANMSGSTILDNVGSVNLGLDSGVDGSVTGQVLQARNFNGATRWRASSTSQLNYAADLTIRFWFKVYNLSHYHHPIGRAYGAEYATIVYPTGEFAVYWGGSGGSSPPYQGIFTAPGSIVANTWYHITFTRDMTSRIARLYLNGEIKEQVPVWITPAVSGQFTYIGWLDWTNQFMEGAIDELAISTTALSPLQVKLSYEKGLAGSLDTASGSTTLQSYRDVANTLKLYPQGTAQQVAGRNQLGLQLSGKSVLNGDAAPFYNLFSTGACTIETWVKLGTNNPGTGSLMFDNMTLPISPTGDLVGAPVFKEGMWRYGFKNDGRIHFTYLGALRGAGAVSVTNNSGAITGSGTTFTSEFKNGDFVKFSNQPTTVYQISSISTDTALSLTAVFTGATSSGITISKIGRHQLFQTTAANVYKPASFNYYGLSMDGSISGVTLVLNGYVMQTVWIVEQVNIPVTSVTNYAMTYKESAGTILDSLRISNIAKSLPTLQNYFRGFIL